MHPLFYFRISVGAKDKKKGSTAILQQMQASIKQKHRSYIY